MRLAADRMNNSVATTGTSAQGPGNSRTPSISAPHDRITANAVTDIATRNHIGQRRFGTTAPTRTPTSSSQALAKLL